jgi:hypothetical protein
MSFNLSLSRGCLLGMLISSLWWFPVQAAELADTVDKVKASIVAVGTVQPTRRPPAKFQATGFVVSQGRQVITNAHALPDFLDTPNKETLAVFIGQNQHVVSRPAKKVAIDLVHDLRCWNLTAHRCPHYDWVNRGARAKDRLSPSPVSHWASCWGCSP